MSEPTPSAAEKPALGNHDCEYDSDGAPCNHCGKTASEAILYFERRIHHSGQAVDEKAICPTCGAVSDNKITHEEMDAIEQGQAVDEWTPEYVRSILSAQSLGGCVITHELCRAVANAHNATEREQVKRIAEFALEVVNKAKDLQSQLNKSETFMDEQGQVWRELQPAKGQAVDRQGEWTTQYVHELMRGAGADARIADAHNAELTADRQRREQAETYLRDATEKNLKLNNDLLSALAAIEEHKNTAPCQNAYPLTVDLSLLHQHDAELTEKVRKPLVETLQEARYVIGSLRSFALSGESLTASDEQNIQSMLNTIDALAQCKQP